MNGGRWSCVAMVAASLGMSDLCYADDVGKICASVGSLAETIMEKRQQGAPMQKMMEVSAQTTVQKVMDPMIVLAYETPRFMSYEAQKRAIEDFRDQMYLSCVKAKGKKK